MDREKKILCQFCGMLLFNTSETCPKCDSIIENALAIEDIPVNSTREEVKERKFRNMTPYPPAMVSNPDAKDAINVVKIKNKNTPSPGI